MSYPEKSSNFTPIVVALIAAIATLGAAYLATKKSENIPDATSPIGSVRSAPPINKADTTPVYNPNNDPKYQSITNFEQTWMAKNFDNDRYQNGDLIPEASNAEQLNEYNQNNTGCWCYYKFNPANGAKYGKLYNWHAVNDPRGLAPDGWHIPRSNEWETIINNNGGIENAGLKLKSSSGWYNNGNGSNSTKWSGLPSGVVYTDGSSTEYATCGAWWSKTVDSPGRSIFFQLDASNGAHTFQIPIGSMCSVRFIKD